MAQRTGTYTLEDLLAARFSVVRAVEFGVDTLVDVLQADLAVHNAIMEELLGEFADPTFDIFRRQGTSIDGEFNEVDEIGRTPTQKVQPGNTVVEHGFGTRLRIYINRADEAAWTALSGFAVYPQPEMTTGTAAGIPTNATLDITRMDNRAIGRYKAAEVWVKPWTTANYAICIDVGNASKPLAFRRDRVRPGLYTAAQLNAFPLIAEYMQAFLGFAVWNRGNGAVLQFNNATYTIPTIT
jgi:hypothetical protein